MQLTRTLLGFLNRVFNKDPQPFVALRIGYGGPMTWAVADTVLTTAPVGGVGAPLTIDLTQYTIAGLATFLAAQPGYTVTFTDPSRSGLSCRALLDATGDVSVSGSVFAYGSTLWSILDGFATQLFYAEQSVALAPQMMQTTTGTGSWLDVIGGIYGVLRNLGETDGQYGPRIIATVLRACNNNFAIAATLEYYTGYKYDVIDGAATVPVFTFNGAVLFDGSHDWDSTAGNYYGLFDVIIHTGAGLSTGAFNALVATIRPLIQVIRAGGTNVRNITQTV